MQGQEARNMSNKAKLVSSDHQAFELDAVALASESLYVGRFLDKPSSLNSRHLLEGPIPHKGEILAKVIEYCKYHADMKQRSTKGITEASIEEETRLHAQVRAWDAEFLKEVDNDNLFELILAALYLEVKGLLDLVCQTARSRQDEGQDSPGDSNSD